MKSKSKCASSKLCFSLVFSCKLFSPRNFSNQSTLVAYRRAALAEELTSLKQDKGFASSPYQEKNGQFRYIIGLEMT